MNTNPRSMTSAAIAMSTKRPPAKMTRTWPRWSLLFRVIWRSSLLPLHRFGDDSHEG